MNYIKSLHIEGFKKFVSFLRKYFWLKVQQSSYYSLCFTNKSQVIPSRKTTYL